MKKIVTHWAYMNYASGEPQDVTGLFSHDIDEGWEIQNVCSAIDTYENRPIVVVTALLSK